MNEKGLKSLNIKTILCPECNRTMVIDSYTPEYTHYICMNGHIWAKVREQ